jgi:flagellar biosynthetic protein FliP
LRAIFALAIALGVFVTPANAQPIKPTPSVALAPSQLPPGGMDLANSSEEIGADSNPLAMMAGVGDAIEGTTTRSGARRSGLSSSINILVVMSVISLAPSIMLMCTCFVRIMIVLGLVKQALGTQTLPPPQVIVGLSLFMTLLVMAPTLDRIHKEAVVPYRNGQITDYDTLWNKSKQPLRDFMLDQIEATGNWSSVYMVLNYRGIDTSEPAKLSTDDVDMISLVPAFMLSELKVGFLLGFKVYLPFLVIDIVISSLLISMGMMMLPPVLISLPFKLLLFVLVDGWTLVVGSLMQSFVTHPTAPAAAHAAAAPLLTHFGFG